jgi:hypothetical protein
MLAPPLLARRWDEGFATLFTAAYRPAHGVLEYHWPGRSEQIPLNGAVPEGFEVDVDDAAGGC